MCEWLLCMYLRVGMSGDIDKLRCCLFDIMLCELWELDFGNSSLVLCKRYEEWDSSCSRRKVVIWGLLGLDCIRRLFIMSIDVNYIDSGIVVLVCSYLLLLL